MEMITRVYDQLESGGLVRTRWAAGAPIGFERVEEGWQVREWSDAVLDLHYCELAQSYRGPVEIFIPGFEKKFIRVLAWAIQKDRVSQCMRAGAASYASMTKRWPKWAFIDKIPKGAEEGVEVDGVCLIQADWALPGFLFIGG